MVRIISAIVAILLCTNAHAFLKVTATVDKNPVVVNESFVLTVTADDDVDTNALDTSPLLKDFIVGRTSVSSQTSMVNFNTTRLTKWTTVLIARKEGSYQIPPLSIDGEQTNAIKLDVIAANDPAASAQQDLFITTDISAKEVYVQQQITLTVKLHFSSELKRGSLSEPELTGANISQIGKDNESETIINGRRYRIIERTYAISPQQSGEFTIKSPLFSGEIMKPSTRRGGFLSFAETKPVSVIGEEISITVKPIPANYQGVWLPSELLAIHQEWQPKPEAFKVGDPITRIITLTAAGLSEEQLPAIEMQMPAGLKVYPDQAELHTGINNNRLVSQKVRNFAIVASKPGTYELPEITIPWWNTRTNRLEHATIDAQMITIAPNADAPLAPEIKQPAIESVPAADNQALPVQTVVIEKSPWLQWLFLALWLLTSLAWLISSWMRKQTPAPTVNKAQISDAHLALLAACKQNDYQGALKQIVPWFNQLTASNNDIKPAVKILDVINSLNNEAFNQAVYELQRNAYSNLPSKWQGQALAQAIQAINKQNLVANNSSNQLALNP